ncbi:hypothetical protein [uncultured Nitratireductor sp.]|uniref:hypothetical protein n=1 Tax=uncultured Nitratireductor sp. TaxID=520953 RepID=UPI0025FBE165|nr:hypothetical protein [uncultured Nitratireductor sp.]
MWNERQCRICGCSDDYACYCPDHGPCSWVEADLCSSCANMPPAEYTFQRRHTHLIECGFLFGIGFMIALAAGWLGYAGIRIFL